MKKGRAKAQPLNDFLFWITEVSHAWRMESAQRGKLMLAFGRDVKSYRLLVMPIKQTEYE